MAEYPAAIKAFSDIVDGTDFMEATQVNQAYEEIEALQTMIGALGFASNQTDSITSLLQEYRHGCKVKASGDAEIKVEAGEVVCVDASGNKKLRRNTSETTVNWGNIDTGSEANSKRYYVHAVADTAATTFTIEVSLSATAPDGVTTFKLLGSFFNNSSGNIVDVMDNLHLLYKEPGSLQPWPTATAPGGAILCDGAATVGTTVDPTLADLFAVIGNVYGGSDATDFVVPDMRGRVIAGCDDMGQGSADRVVDAQADSEGGVTGTETHTLTGAESGVPVHTHPISVVEGGGNGGYVRGNEAATGSGTPNTGNNTAANAASAHTSMQPTMFMSWIIWK